MIFKYYEVTPEIIRPIIEVILKSETRVGIFPSLIDSGADHCIFSIDTAKLLGIKRKPENKTTIAGIGRDVVKGCCDELELRIADRIYTTRVIFAKISDYGFGILGQQGFFDHFDVNLSYQKQEIEIMPIKISN